MTVSILGTIGPLLELGDFGGLLGIEDVEIEGVAGSVLLLWNVC